MIPDALTTLLDPARLAVAGALVGVERRSDDLVEHTGLDAPTVLAAVGELRRVGLVEPVGGRYTIAPGRLHALAAEVADNDLPMDPVIGFAMTDGEIAILERFFAARTLVEIPASRAKRLVVLERISHEFDLGRRYTEPEVDAILKPFHPDVAALRRHLVDEDFLGRDRSGYLRNGGRT